MRQWFGSDLCQVDSGKESGRGFFRRAIRSLVVVAGATAWSVASLAQEPVAIPNFWNLNERAGAANVAGIDVIRFVTSDDYPPFNFEGPDGRLMGFNVDLARAVCEELDLPCTIQVRPFEDLVAAIEADRADAVIAGIEITAQTRESLAFSEVYLQFPGRFVVRRGLPLAVDDLARERVAVTAGTAHEAYLRAFFQQAEIVAFETDAEARAALRSGETDLLFGDGMQLSFWLQGTTAGDCCQFSGGPFLESAYFGQGMAIAVDPDRPDILSALNEGLRAAFESGVYAATYLRYFPVSFF